MAGLRIALGPPAACARFHTLAFCRLLRFGLEAALAARYGRQILSWLESDRVQDIAAFFIVLAIGLTVFSTVRLVRSAPHPRSVRVKT